MRTHAPGGYACPFCRVACAEFSGNDLLTVANDVVLRTDTVVAFVAAHWWQHNPGHVLVIPVTHIENLYAMPNDLAAEVHEASRRVAVAMRSAYDGCQGISTRQHNEPVGGQDVWHYHLHVFPRFINDALYLNDASKRLVTPEQRAPYAKLLRESLFGCP